MKINILKLLFSLSLMLLTVSCDWLNTDDTELSSNPSFVSLTFSKNDSIPYLHTAKFTLEWDDILNDSIIVNLDSLPYKTRIDSVFPKFSFKSSSGAFLTIRDSLGTGLDTVILTGTDTINFNRVISVTNTPADGDTLKSRTYLIKVNVHKVQSELYVWRKTVDQLYTQPANMQKAISRNDTIFFYASSGINNYLYIKKTGHEWKETKVNGLPNYSNLYTIAAFNNKFYLIDDNVNIYSTSNGIDWKKELNSDNYKFLTFLFELDGKFWAITKSETDGKNRFAYTTSGDKWFITGEIPANFPVGGFAALSFYSRTKKPKAVVLGGYSHNGKLLNNIWSTENGTYWVDFTVENVTLDSLAGATIIHYDDKLLLFGGMNDDGKLVDTNYMQSIDEGLSWSKPDTAYTQIRELVSNDGNSKYNYYEQRSFQSVVYMKEPNVVGTFNHNIYLIGGRDAMSNVYTDVWVGKLNRLSFKRK